MRTVVCLVLVLVGSLSLTAQGLNRNLKLTQPRMNGNDVMELQNRLVSLGFSDLGTVDGWYGPKTEASVRRSQGLLGVLKTGVVNSDFWQLLASTDAIGANVLRSLLSANIFEKEVLAHSKNTQRVYNYLSGQNYSVSKYSLSEDKSGAVFLYQLIVPMKLGDLGYFVYKEISTPSGDHFTVQQDYYGPDGKLFLATLNINTSYAEEPATIEKRFYFDADGNPDRKTVQIYKMNTDVPLKSDFGDREVEIIRQVNDIPYWSLLKW
jgi:peptidoglycan hydrolase-like protein with peptidoglycan-binding domain